MLVNADSVLANPLNSGVDAQVKMSAPALFILIPLAAKWQLSDEVDFLEYIEARIQDVPSKRWYPLFGNKAPIRTVNDGKETDLVVTYDDGSIAFIRNGTITRTFITNKGGMAYTQFLLSINRLNNYGFIEVDKFNNIIRRVNPDGSLSALKPNACYAATPDPAGLKDEYRSGFVLNYTVEEYVQNGQILYSTESLLDLMGLVNATPVNPTATTTQLTFGIQTIGSQTDLIAALTQSGGAPNPWALISNFVVTNAAGTVITPTAAAIVNGNVVLTIPTQAVDNILTIGLAPAATLAANGISGYEGTQTVNVTIP